VIDAWTFEQAIKETTENGVSWFSTKVSFSEDSWYQELRWNGEDDTIVRYDINANEGNSTANWDS
jgi:hypothetical protein